MQSKNPQRILKLTISYENLNYVCRYIRKRRRLFSLLRFECPGQESNLHAETGTTPSKWRVYQFHHLGINL